MKKKKILFALFLSIIISLFLFIGCQESISEKGKDGDKDKKEKIYILSGYWKSSYGDGFEISGTNFSQYDDASNSLSFAGTIVNNPDFTASSNYITLQITDGGTWGKTVGNYYVIHYKGFSKTTVKESCAYKSGGQSGNPTQAGAEAEFTIANGYFSYYGDYEKQ
jgi:hypothetical protein